MSRPNATIGIPAKTRVLIVEDNTMRNRWFSDQICASTTFATTPQAGLDALKNASYDLVFHDFDSGPNMWNGGDLTDTFDGVADRLIEAKHPGVVVVHSLNPAGAERLRQKFRQAGIPVAVHAFGTFDIKMGVREQ